MWNNWDIATRKKFMENITTTFFVLGLMSPFLLGLIGAGLHNNMVIVMGLIACFLSEIITLIAWVWGDWIAVNIPFEKKN